MCPDFRIATLPALRPHRSYTATRAAISPLESAEQDVALILMNMASLSAPDEALSTENAEDMATADVSVNSDSEAIIYGNEHSSFKTQQS